RLCPLPDVLRPRPSGARRVGSRAQGLCRGHDADRPHRHPARKLLGRGRRAQLAHGVGGRVVPVRGRAVPAGGRCGGPHGGAPRLHGAREQRAQEVCRARARGQAVWRRQGRPRPRHQACGRGRGRPPCAKDRRGRVARGLARRLPERLAARREAHGGGHPAEERPVDAPGRT
ncbi:hypothetical protein MNEG_14223, partial [Monoraphidium neglectum]